VAHKTFGRRTDTEEAEAPDPITFDLAYEEDIACRPRVNGKLLIELVGKVDSGSVALQSEGILQVFEITAKTDDGENPDGYSGKPFARHTAAELQALDDVDEGEEPMIAGIDPTSSLGRLTAVLDDPETEIDVEELAEIVGWIVEQYTGRPTRKPGALRTGQSSMRPSSRRARRSQARATDREQRTIHST
jgi:hypothetical protein